MAEYQRRILHGTYQRYNSSGCSGDYPPVQVCSSGELVICSGLGVVVQSGIHVASGTYIASGLHVSISGQTVVVGSGAFVNISGQIAFQGLTDTECLKGILLELRIIRMHLEIVTGNVIKEEDINIE